MECPDALCKHVVVVFMLAFKRESGLSEETGSASIAIFKGTPLNYPAK